MNESSVQCTHKLSRDEKIEFIIQHIVDFLIKVCFLTNNDFNISASLNFRKFFFLCCSLLTFFNLNFNRSKHQEWIKINEKFRTNSFFRFNVYVNWIFSTNLIYRYVFIQSTYNFASILSHDFIIQFFFQLELIQYWAIIFFSVWFF